MLLNNQCVTEKNQRRYKKYLEANENGNNLCNSAKILLRVYCNTRLPRETIKKSHINNLTLHLKELEKKNKHNPMLAGGKT